MGILSDLLKKRNIASVDELQPDERATFAEYERVLSKQNLSIEDITRFLEIQIAVIEGKWRDYQTTDKAALIPYHTCYRVLLEAIKAPQKERENLEQYLTTLIK